MSTIEIVLMAYSVGVCSGMLILSLFWGSDDKRDDIPRFMPMEDYKDGK